MENITVFEYDKSSVRTIVVDGTVYFVAKDVCEALSITNPNNVYQRLHAEDIVSMEVEDSIGRKQKMYLVNESGLYDLIFESRKDEAKVFRRWVTTEVLPSIRKTGKYELQKDSLTAMNLMRQQLDYLIEHEKQLREHKEKLENHETRLSEIEAQITTVNKDYLSLAGYYALKKQTWGLSQVEASQVGKKLKKASDLAGMPIIRIHDSKFGEVNGYHKDILAQVLGF